MQFTCCRKDQLVEKTHQKPKIQGRMMAACADSQWSVGTTGRPELQAAALLASASMQSPRRASRAGPGRPQCSCAAPLGSRAAAPPLLWRPPHAPGTLLGTCYAPTHSPEAPLRLLAAGAAPQKPQQAPQDSKDQSFLPRRLRTPAQPRGAQGSAIKRQCMCQATAFPAAPRMRERSAARRGRTAGG